MGRFLFPRIISITRPSPDSGIGAQGYGGVRESTETSLFANIPAHIEADRQGTAPDAKLPADAAGQSIWKIIFKLPLGSVQTGDIITSEIGDRYQVIASDWGPLVTTCRCQIQQT